jgi:N-acetylmuramoyl-L-alanine amidase
MFAPLTVPDASDSSWVVVEAVRAADTVRVRWPLRMAVLDPARPPVVIVDDDVTGTGTTDSTLAGRPSPYGTYHWFFPTGTVAAVSGRWNDQVRLQLSRSSVAWVDAQDVHPLPPGTPPPTGRARSMRLVPGAQSAVLRIPLPSRIPFRVEETEDAVAVTLYGVASDMDWIQYSGTDPFVRLITFAQHAEDEATVTMSLSQPLWGYRTRWDEHDFLIEVRRPPVIDPQRPLKGRLVVLDPGHPPGGATGPTGVREPDVVLAVARKTKQLLEEHGATVTLTRDSDSSMGLVERTRLAELVNADVLVSIHANALPDGMNPFVNNGTSVYFNHPRSASLARATNRALVRQLGFRDLGVGRGDLALARPTWMPAVLTEGLFMMLPDQEAVLSSEEGQWRYARGLVEGVAAFFIERVPGRRTRD